MIFKRIRQLIDYAIAHGLIEKSDETFMINALLPEFKLMEFNDCEAESAELEEILAAMDDYAVENGIIDDGVVSRDLFDAKLMGILTPRPSEVIKKFNDLYASSPSNATDWYYDFSRANDYIRTYRVKKDLKWVTEIAFLDCSAMLPLKLPSLYQQREKQWRKGAV